jgi:CRP-like cAMP-binding protein
MDTASIVNYIQQTINMPKDKAELIASKFEYIELNKNETILEEGKISKQTVILAEGFIRSHTTDTNGVEITTNIFSPYAFVNDVLSFFKQVPASESFQAITPCKVWRMSFDDVQQGFHGMPEFREFGRMMLITNYSALKRRMLGMIKDTAEKRYTKLLQQHADIFQNVPLKMIATYLGITDTSLSRIRRELAHK